MTKRNESDLQVGQRVVFNGYCDNVDEIDCHLFWKATGIVLSTTKSRCKIAIPIDEATKAIHDYARREQLNAQWIDETIGLYRDGYIVDGYLLHVEGYTSEVDAIDADVERRASIVERLTSASSVASIVERLTSASRD